MISTKKVWILILLAALLLSACGGAAPEEDEERSGGRSRNRRTEEPTTREEDPEEGAPEEPGGSAVPPKNQPEAVALRPEDVAGLWELYSYEAEGAEAYAAEEGIQEFLLLRSDGTGDFISSQSPASWEEWDYCSLDIDDSGRLCMELDAWDQEQTFVFSARNGEELEVTGEWTNPDGTPGGNSCVFRLVEAEGPDFLGRELSSAELDDLTYSLDYAENGFFLSTYDRPEEIDWNEVCYCGAGLSDSSQEIVAAYEREVGELWTSLEAIPAKALEDFVWEKTQTPYSIARRPLARFWGYLEDYDVWTMEHGDTNFQPISFTGGWRNGNLFRLNYTRMDGENSFWEDREFTMTAIIRDGNWQYVSNLPADATPPITLVTIEFLETQEDARDRGAIGIYPTVFLPSEEPSGLCWALVTAQTDGVRYSFDRAVWDSDEEGLIARMSGFNPTDENLTSGVLRSGESVALQVNRPWYGSLRLMVTKDSYYGDFWFEADRWPVLLEDDVIRYVTGHDYAGEGRGCDPRTGMELFRLLTDGPWGWMDPDTGTVRALLCFPYPQMAQVMTTENVYEMYLAYDHLYTAVDEVPDMFAVRRYEEDESWSGLPAWFGESLGDYQIFTYQMDGEQILTLQQVNNGDGVLAYLLPGAGEYDTSYTFVRFQGTAEFEGQG